MQSNTPALHSCSNCPLQHYPHGLLDGIDELGDFVTAIQTVADLMCPVTSDPGVDLHLVSRSDLATLLTVLTRNAQWHLNRTQSDYYSRGKPVAAVVPSGGIR